MTESECGLDIAFRGNSIQEDGELHANVRLWRKADLGLAGGERPLLTQSGHSDRQLSGLCISSVR